MKNIQKETRCRQLQFGDTFMLFWDEISKSKDPKQSDT